jgi:hypothetical protein
VSVEQTATGIEPMDPSTWPHSPVPTTDGTGWEWRLSSLAELHQLRVEMRRQLRAAGCDEAADDPVCDRLLLAVDELSSNGLRHGTGPVGARVVAVAGGWLIDVTDCDTGHGPEPAVDRDPAFGGMGLNLVADLTTSRGWTVTDGRKHVWARLPT